MLNFTASPFNLAASAPLHTLNSGSLSPVVSRLALAFTHISSLLCSPCSAGCKHLPAGFGSYLVYDSGMGVLMMRSQV